MDVLDGIRPPRPPLTGGNATELGIGTSRRQSGVVIRETAGHPREQAREVSRDGDVDPFKLGFDRIMSRFDQLEMRMDNSDRRMDKLEGPPIQDADFSAEESNSDDREYRSHRDTYVQPEGCEPRRQAGYRGGRPPRGGIGTCREGVILTDERREHRSIHARGARQVGTCPLRV